MRDERDVLQTTAITAEQAGKDKGFMAKVWFLGCPASTTTPCNLHHWKDFYKGSKTPLNLSKLSLSAELTYRLIIRYQFPFRTRLGVNNAETFSQGIILKFWESNESPS
jgi:hypothetical protein